MDDDTAKRFEKARAWLARGYTQGAKKKSKQAWRGLLTSRLVKKDATKRAAPPVVSAT